MKTTDRAILFGVLILGSLAAFWLLVLSPKRAEVSKLDKEVSELETAVSEQQQLVLAGEAAQDSYARNYHRLVVLGKAVPAGDDAPSLFIEIEAIAKRGGR